MEEEIELAVEEAAGHGRSTRRTSNLSNSTISPPGRQLRNGRSKRTDSPDAESSVYGDIESGVDGDVSEEEGDEDHFEEKMVDESATLRTRTLRNGQKVEPVLTESDDEEVDMSFELEVEPEIDEEESNAGQSSFPRVRYRLKLTWVTRRPRFGERDQEKSASMQTRRFNPTLR